MFRKWLPCGLIVVMLASVGWSQDRVSPLSDPVDWDRLSVYDQVITRSAFLQALTTIYSVGEAYQHTIDVQEDHVRILTGEDRWMTLRFRKEGEVRARPVKRFWRPRAAMAPGLTEKEPLRGIRVALDPGHIGGKWAQIEERWFVMGDGDDPVREGDMTLIVAQLLKPQLEALGAVVMPVRVASTPTTTLRPPDFEALARIDLKGMGIEEPALTYPPEALPEERRKTVQWHSEKYFYRLSEIRHRATLVNEKLQPDVALCLHFNAEAWGDPNAPALVPRNHLHFLINGAYSVYELGLHDERMQMLLRLLQGVHLEEMALAEAVAPAMARHTQLPAYHYATDNVKRPSNDPYIYARNLLANRLFECPVLYFEPYVMNCEDVYARIQAGPYEGMREVNGVNRVSIYHEYVHGVVDGLVAYYAPMKGAAHE